MNKYYFAVGALALLTVLLILPQSSAPIQDESIVQGEDAVVMYFYSDACSWCQKQKPILGELSAEGYSVKLMDVGTNPGYWKEYGIQGTPTFIGPDGERLVGFQSKEKLVAFLNKY